MADITQVVVQCLLDANDYEYMNGLANLAVANQALSSTQLAFYLACTTSVTMTVLLAVYTYLRFESLNTHNRLTIRNFLRDWFAVMIWVSAIGCGFFAVSEGRTINEAKAVIQQHEATIGKLTLPDPQITASCGFKVAGNDDIQMVSIDLAEDGEPSTINYEYTTSK